MTDQVILVDENNRRRGAIGKLAAHRTSRLHRAFSVFLVNRQGKLLLQQRQLTKYHSGGKWANSCCGHPRPGEKTMPAAVRRLGEELGVSAGLEFAFVARYHLEVGRGLVENELAYVFFGRLRARLQPNPSEVKQVRWLSPDDARRLSVERPETVAKWMRYYMTRHFASIQRATVRLARDWDSDAEGS